MLTDPRHIILLGFKHVGKSSVAKPLAAALQRPVIDLDECIVEHYHGLFDQRPSCREIFQRHGELFFRDCETQALRQALCSTPAVIALGGGAALRETNQHLINAHWLVHLTAAAANVYARIMADGDAPAFFPADQDPVVFFQQLWHQYATIYAGLTDMTVDNTGTLTETVRQILEKWEHRL